MIIPNDQGTIDSFTKTCFCFYDVIGRNYFLDKIKKKTTILKTEVPTNDASLSFKGEDNVCHQFVFKTHTFYSFFNAFYLKKRISILFSFFGGFKFG